MPIISLKEIHVSFGPRVIFDKLDMNFYPHEKVGVVGPNGCGKTTLLKLILGDVTADIGQVHKRKGLKTGYLPQEPMFGGEKSVAAALL